MLKILKILYNGDILEINRVAKSFEVTERTIENDISFLKNNGLIRFEGPPKTGRYVLMKKGEDVLEQVEREY